MLRFTMPLFTLEKIVRELESRLSSTFFISIDLLIIFFSKLEGLKVRGIHPDCIVINFYVRFQQYFV